MSILSRMSLFLPQLGGQSRKGASLLARVFTLQAIWTERKKLASLDPDRLRDLGITPDEARREAKRAAWDAPERWLQ